MRNRESKEKHKRQTFHWLSGSLDLVCLCYALPFARHSCSAGGTGSPAGEAPSSKPELPDIVERRQKGFEMLAIGQYPVNEATTGSYNLTGYLHKVHQEAFELHPQDITTYCRRLRHQAIPGLQIPRQRCDDHVGPVRYQTVRRHPQGVHSTLELTDDVFLVAAIVGKKDHFSHRHLPIVGDVEEVPDLIKQPVLPLFDREVLPNHNHAIGFLTVSGTIVKLGDLLALQADVLEFSLLDYLFFDVFRTAPFFALDLITRRPLERFPLSLRQGIGHPDQVRLGVITKDKTNPLVPAIEVSRQREIRVAPKPDLRKHRRHQIDCPVHPLGRSVGRGTVARPIHQIEDLIRIGQGHDQRCVTPDPVVGNVHSFLAFPQGSGDGPVHVDDGLLPEGSILQLPHLGSGFIDGFLKSEDPILIETTEEISSRRGIRNPLGSQSVHVGLILAQPLDIFETGSTRQDVVCDVQYMIGFPVRKVVLEQNDVSVDIFVQSKLTHELVNGSDTTRSDGARSLGDLVVGVGVLEHRIGPVLKLISFQPACKILLVSEEDSVVSFIHLECAPFGMSCKYIKRILSRNGARSRAFLPPHAKNHAGLRPSRLGYELTDSGGLSASTANTASEVTRGYGRILPDIGRTAPAGLAIFGFTSGGVLVSEAGVPASPLIQAGRIYAEVAGAVNTGLAIANPNSFPATITFNFTDSAGTDFGSGTITIAAGGQIAKFLNQDPFNSGDIVNGTFTFNSDVPISVVALRGFINERGDLLITTLPVAPLGTTSTATGLFPHFAAGGGWITQLILVNPTDGILTGRVEFFSQGSDMVPGAPATVTIDGVAASSFAYSIPGRSSRRFVPSGASMVTTSGSVRIVPDPGNSAPSGLGVFSFKPNMFTVAEAGVPLLEPATSVRMYAESTTSIQTGVAVANPSSSPATVTFELSTLPGTSTGLTGTATIPGNGQIATFLDQISGLENLTTPFQGVLRISTTSTAGLSIVGLRSHVNQRDDFLITTTSPVDENATASTDEQLFPHFAYGAGWSTQFILFDSSGASTSGDLHFLSSAGESSDVRFADISTVKMISPFSHTSPQGVTAEGSRRTLDA